jgi:AcrR family transcriptional regulator
MASEPARKRQPGAPAVPAIGLRERKKQKTKEAIQRVALRLFEKHGYDETTIEDIAAAVEISPSTFFNYFPTKDDVVQFDAYDPMVLSMLQQQPRGTPLNVVLRRVLEPLGEVFRHDREILVTRARLVLEVPELRGRIWEEIERSQALMTAALAQQSGRDPDEFELRVTVRVLIAAIWEAFVEWSRDPRQDFVRLAERALDQVETGLLNERRRSREALPRPRRKARVGART